MGINEVQQAIDWFNPDALKLQTGDLKIELATQKLKYHIYVSRPEGDFLSHLLREIERIPEPKETQQQTAYDKAELSRIVVGVAALEQLITPEAARVVGEELKYLMPKIDFFWQSLTLFKAVIRYADAHGIELPASMRDARQAFGRSILRSVTTQKHESKTQYRNVLSGSAKALRQKQNPFGDDCPEDRDFVQFAFTFTYWNDKTRDEVAKLPPSERARLGALRKAIREALAHYARSMQTLAAYYKNSRNVVAIQWDSQNRLQAIGERGKLTPIDE